MQCNVCLAWLEDTESHVSLSSKGGGGAAETSPIWKYINKPVKHPNGSSTVECTICHQHLAYHSATTNMTKHMRSSIHIDRYQRDRLAVAAPVGIKMTQTAINPVSAAFCPCQFCVCFV